jgi:hypothetical protein
VTDHGYTREEADTLAPRLVDDWEECAICGVLGWLVKLNARKGLRFIGAERQNRHFHPDRLDTSQPHTLPNTRILCPTCNLRRGAARFTDQEVLRWVRSQWERLFSPRWLWWLNTEPGEGGREHRNPGRPS